MGVIWATIVWVSCKVFFLLHVTPHRMNRAAVPCSSSLHVWICHTVDRWWALPRYILDWYDQFVCTSSRYSGSVLILFGTESRPLGMGCLAFVLSVLCPCQSGFLESLEEWSSVAVQLAVQFHWEVAALRNCSDWSLWILRGWCDKTYFCGQWHRRGSSESKVSESWFVGYWLGFVTRGRVVALWVSWSGDGRGVWL